MAGVAVVDASAGVEVQYPSVQDDPLVEGGAEGPMQAVLKVELAPPVDDMGEEVTVERGVSGQQGLKIQFSFGRDQLVQPYLARRDLRPVPGPEPMLGVGTSVTDSLEDHPKSLRRGIKPEKAPGLAVHHFSNSR
ncbi:hypothetical protein SAMN04489712_11582 [Thermomonospora echinospora]|uniref:Uncharacterized protein n=1 Tax=Thermomonospora echinospora TaxID=1992 RepID=A0A1H6DBR2_9ACTN|nr:hypothetical protein SAMN04489712_11582 [Thermomonospora echinospora]